MSERDLDIVLDHLGTLNDLTPKLWCEGKSGVPPNLIFGLDSKQFIHPQQGDKSHHSQVETLTISRGLVAHHDHDQGHLLTRRVLTDALGTLPKDVVYRVKGFILLQDDTCDQVLILNWAFGRFDLVPLTVNPKDPLVERMKPGDALLTVMGAAGQLKPYGRSLAQALGARVAV